MVRTLATTRSIEADPEEAGLSSSGLENVSRVVQRYVDERLLPGAISMVARRGRVVHFETYGSMDEEAGKETRDDTIYRIYSMTKPIASVALMQLYEQGLFDLGDPVSKFVPQLKDLKVLAGGTAESFSVRPAAREMTIQDLLIHTSGLTAAGPSSTVGQLYRQAGLNGSSSGGTLAGFIDKLAELPLKCDPGAEWNYGVSTDVVGHLIEVLSGQRLDEYLRAHILDPLGMVDTSFEIADDKLDRFAANYTWHADSRTYSPIDAPATSSYRSRTYLSAAGGLTSTAADYMRFCKMLANGGELDGARILGPRTIAFMTRNHLPANQDIQAMDGSAVSETTRDGMGFGLGFAVLMDPAKAQLIGTPGEYYWGGAASTAFFINPAEDLVMVFMTQLMPSSTHPVRRELRQAIYGSIID